MSYMHLLTQQPYLRSGANQSKYEELGYTVTQLSFGQDFRLDNMMCYSQTFILEAKFFTKTFQEHLLIRKSWVLGKDFGPDYLNFTKLSSVEIGVLWYQDVTDFRHTH